MTLHLMARKTGLILAGISLYLCVHSIVGKAIEYAAGVNNTYGLYHFVQLFNVNREGNIPAWYSTLLLLSAALLLAIIARAKHQAGDRFRYHWTGLAFVFVYLSLDESAAIHEKFTIPVQEGLNTTGYLYFGWVVVAAPLVILLGLVYLRFVMHLPRETQRLFVLAGLLYIGGALGVEVISANRWYLDDGTSLAFSAIGTVEELLEMWGVVLFIYALLRYAGRAIGVLHIHLGAPAPTTDPAEEQPSA